jgi:hypothetical protein
MANHEDENKEAFLTYLAHIIIFLILYLVGGY